MKSHSLSQTRRLASCLAIGCAIAHAQADTSSRWRTHALLNLDAGGVPPRELSLDHAPLELADAEFGLGARLTEDLGVDAVVVHDDGQALIDQAFATWAAPVATLAFGQQALPVGLFAGRLIHDPLLQADVETIAPSLWVHRAFGPLEAHLAVAQETQDIDSLASSRHPTAIAAIDLASSTTTKLRLSGKCAHHLRLIDLGAEIGWGPLVFDLEGLMAEGAWTTTQDAFLAGIAWTPVSSTTLAARLDAHRSQGWTRSFALGVVQRFAEVAYAGAEWLQDLDGDGILTLRWGLEVELPRP